MAKKKEAKKVKVAEENAESIVDTILKGVSYGTGVIVRKAADIGKVSKTKSWKKVVSQAGDLCEKVNTGTKVMIKKAKKSVTTNITDMKESFKEGMESATEETASAPANSEVKVKEIPVMEHHSDDAKIKKAIDAIAYKHKTPSPTKKKSGINDKPKASSKKAKPNIKAEKEAPVNADLEKEIDDATKDVKEI